MSHNATGQMSSSLSLERLSMGATLKQRIAWHTKVVETPMRPPHPPPTSALFSGKREDFQSWMLTVKQSLLAASLGDVISSGKPEKNTTIARFTFSDPPMVTRSAGDAPGVAGSSKIEQQNDY